MTTRQIRNTNCRKAYELCIEEPTTTLGTIMRKTGVSRNSASRYRQLARKDLGLPPRVGDETAVAPGARDAPAPKPAPAAPVQLDPPTAPEPALEDFQARFQAPTRKEARRRAAPVQRAPPQQEGDEVKPPARPAPDEPAPEKPRHIHRKHVW